MHEIGCGCFPAWKSPAKTLFNVLYFSMEVQHRIPSADFLASCPKSKSRQHRPLKLPKPMSVGRTSGTSWERSTRMYCSEESALYFLMQAKADTKISCAEDSIQDSRTSR